MLELQCTNAVTPVTSRSQNPSVLFIGVRSPWRGEAGYLVRQHMFLCALAEIAELHLALFDYQPSSDSAPYPCTITPLPMPPSVNESYLRSALQDLFSPIPHIVRRFDPQAARRIVRDLNPERFDAVFAYRADFAYFAGVLDHPRLLLDIDDPEHIRRRERESLFHNGSLHWLQRLDLARLRRFELKAASQAMAAFVCHRGDQEVFSDALAGCAHRGEPVVAPNCIDVPPERPARLADAPQLLFVGNMEGGAKSPNVDAINWFVREVWPLVCSQVPNAICRVVGAISDELRTSLQSQPRIEVCGFVERVEDCFKRASLSIAPIRFGTGTRIKILQSLAMGCPVVSTPKGCEGLEVTSGRDILVGDSPQAFAECCVRLLTDKAEQERLGLAGYELAANHYDRQGKHQWLVETLQGFLNEAVERRRDAGRSGTLRQSSHGNRIVKRK